MIERWQIIRQARRYVGTPFHHQGRVRGAGIDCVGLIVCVLRDLKIPHEDTNAYSIQGDSSLMLAMFRKHLVEIETHAAKPADILVFWVRKPEQPTHCAILTEKESIIHTSASASKRVVEHVFDERWAYHLSSAFTIPNVGEAYLPPPAELPDDDAGVARVKLKARAETCCDGRSA